MKKLLRVSLLMAALMAVLCISALAADPTTAGMYNVGTGITPVDATAGNASIGETPVTDFYSGAVKFNVSATGYTEGEQCLILVVAGAKGTAVTDSSIYYIDQTVVGTDNSVSFTAYPKDMAKGHYCVYLVSLSHPYNATSPAAEFDYFVPYTPGDVNGDGDITVSDALMVLNHIAENITLTKNYEVKSGVFYDAFDAANVVNKEAKDANITISDAIKILNYVAENITSFD